MSKTEEKTTKKKAVTPAEAYKSKHQSKQVKVFTRSNKQVITHDGLVYKLIDVVSGEVFVSSRSGREKFDQILKENKL